jgi:hypothetical protein
VCLLEALTATTPSGSVDFARALLDALQAVSYNHAQSKSDIDYLEQLLISVLESVVAAIDVSRPLLAYLLCSYLMSVISVPRISCCASG